MLVMIFVDGSGGFPGLLFLLAILIDTEMG